MNANRNNAINFKDLSEKLRVEVATSALTDVMGRRAEDGVPPYYAQVGSNPPGITPEDYIDDIGGRTVRLGQVLGIGLDYDPEASRRASAARPPNHTSRALVRHSLQVAFIPAGFSH